MNGFPYPNAGTMFQAIVNLVSVLDDRGRKQLEQEARAAYMQASVRGEPSQEELYRLTLDTIISAIQQTSSIASAAHIPTAV